MYGYIQIYKDELKLKQIKLYNRYYCMLCTKLKNEISTMYRMLTSFDITACFILFDVLTDIKSQHKIKCPFSKKKSIDIYISDKALQYSFLICLFCASSKLRDDNFDNNKNKMLSSIFHHNKKIKTVFEENEVIQKWNDLLLQYYEKEKDENSTFDILTNTIGDVYGKIFVDYISFSKINFDEKELYSLGFDIGQYIYIMDAYDDYFNDVNHGLFNPICRMFDYEIMKNNKIKIKSKIEFILSIIQRKIVDNINHNFNKKDDRIQILDNIFNFGTYEKFQSISNKKYIIKENDLK